MTVDFFFKKIQFEFSDDTEKNILKIIVRDCQR